MIDILQQLRRASWRDIEFPVMGTRDFGFQHAQAEHRYLFRDEQLVESLGRQNPTYRYTIPFRENIAKGPWRSLLTQVYPQFLAACEDRSRGTLVDPMHGAVPAKCVSLAETLDVGRRDGVDVQVEFIKAPAENAQVSTQRLAFVGVRGSAQSFDRQVAKLTGKDARGRDISDPSLPEPTINALDAGSAVLGQLETSVNQVSATFADAAFRVEKTSASIDRLRDPGAQPVIQQAARLRAALLDLEERVDPIGAKPLRRLTTVSDQTVSVVASKLGMKIEELIRLNGFLARTPLVRAGTQLRVFADAIKPADARVF